MAPKCNRIRWQSCVRVDEQPNAGIGVAGVVAIPKVEVVVHRRRRAGHELIVVAELDADRLRIGFALEMEFGLVERTCGDDVPLIAVPPLPGSHRATGSDIGGAQSADGLDGFDDDAPYHTPRRQPRKFHVVRVTVKHEQFLERAIRYGTRQQKRTPTVCESERIGSKEIASVSVLRGLGSHPDLVFHCGFLNILGGGHKVAPKPGPPTMEELSRFLMRRDLPDRVGFAHMLRTNPQTTFARATDSGRRGAAPTPVRSAPLLPFEQSVRSTAVPGFRSRIAPGVRPVCADVRPRVGSQ